MYLYLQDDAADSMVKWTTSESCGVPAIVRRSCSLRWTVEVVDVRVNLASNNTQKCVTKVRKKVRSQMGGLGDVEVAVVHRRRRWTSTVAATLR